MDAVNERKAALSAKVEEAEAAVAAAQAEVGAGKQEVASLADQLEAGNKAFNGQELQSLLVKSAQVRWFRWCEAGLSGSVSLFW